MVEQADYDSKYLICKCGHEKKEHLDICAVWNCPCKKFEVQHLAREIKMLRESNETT